MTTTPTTGPHRLRRSLGAGLLAAIALTGSAGLIAACGQSTSSSATEQVLPVDTNPIANTASTQSLAIDSVLVENNEDDNGNAVDDHLEITVTNTASMDLTGFEIFVTYDDATDGITESYYTRLPADFTVAAGTTQVIHFDDTGAPGHFPVNAYSLYYSDTNALDVTVEVSATGAAPQTMTVQKDAGGAEVPD